MRLTGAPPNPQKEQILAALHANDGRSMGQIARDIGVSKNVVIGYRKRAGLSVPKPPPLKTMPQRLDALHARMDRVIAETQPALDADRKKMRALDLDLRNQREVRRARRKWEWA